MGPSARLAHFRGSDAASADAAIGSAASCRPRGAPGVQLDDAPSALCRMPMRKAALTRRNPIAQGMLHDGLAQPSLRAKNAITRIAQAGTM